MITKSPMSRCGEYSGLCLPISSPATRVARRPSVWPVASITCHSLWISPPLRLYVVTRFIIKQTAFVANLHQAESTSRRRGCRRPGSGPRYQTLKLLTAQLATPNVCQRPRYAAHHVRQEGVGLDVKEGQPTLPNDISPADNALGAASPRLVGRGECGKIVQSSHRLRRSPHRLHIQPWAHMPGAIAEER